MNQIKTGKFIAELRKEKNLTQMQLADMLAISDKTVSKWECGKGLPEVSMMIPLCEILEINVNELLSGERLSEKEYREKAEENIMDLISEKKESKKKIALAVTTVACSILAAVTLDILVSLFDMSKSIKIAVFVVIVIVLVGSLAVACVLDRDAGSFECAKCHTRFVPTMSEYIKATHTPTRRKLKCPHCGEKTYCKKRLTK